MDEATQERPNVGTDGPRMVRREREIPSVGIMRIGEHYVVHAGCKTEVFHFPSEVGLFLEGLLRDWIRDNLRGDTGGDLRSRGLAQDPGTEAEYPPIMCGRSMTEKEIHTRITGTKFFGM